jgi:hypothetical protein
MKGSDAKTNKSQIPFLSQFLAVKSPSVLGRVQNLAQTSKLAKTIFGANTRLSVARSNCQKLKNAKLKLAGNS